MSRSKHERKQPLHKRYPGRWAMRSIVYTPNGSRLEVVGPTVEPVGRLLIALMATPSSKLDPALAVECEQLAEKLLPPRKKGSAEG
ncbi:MAG: hypothetical protein HOW73_47960 [Polyangiaceae bacterium]|nr:hypothetical protein [Polyangiaceae bacterium]